MSTIINATTTNGVVIEPDNSGSLELQTNSGTTALIIDTSQNVGIGTTSPNCRMHFQGGTNSDGSLTFNNQLTSEAAYSTSPSVGTLVSLKYNSSGSYAGMGGWSIGKENATDGNFASYLALHTRPNGGSTTERMRIDSSGNVGIGTLIPNSYGKLAVNGSIAPMGAAGTYSIDTTLAGAGTTVSSGGTVNFSDASGMLVVNQYNNGAVTIYLCGGGGTTVVANQGSQVGTFAYVAGIAGYRWTSSSTTTYGFFFLRTRPTA